MQAFARLLTLAGAATSVLGAFSGLNLRIAAIGDSITCGAMSSTHDGYRTALVNLLDGNQVNMIGYRFTGVGRDVAIQAHDGWFISNMQFHVNETWSSRPNVYLLHGGTNDIASNSAFGRDCSQSGITFCQDAANAIGQLIDTITYVSNLNSAPALVVVAQIVPGNSPNFGGSLYTSNVQIYNTLIEKQVRKRDYVGTGYKVQLVNMQNQTGGVTLGDISSDGIHPMDSGYLKMALQWYYGLQNATLKGLVPALTPSQGYPFEACSTPFSPNYTSISIVDPRGQSNYYSQVKCSNVTDGTARCTCNDGGSDYFVARTGSCAEMSTSLVTAVKWADLNGDGRQEVFRIASTGQLNASLNLGGPSNNETGKGDGANTLKSRYSERGLVGPSGAKPWQVRLADLDGDARAEYLVVDPTGSVSGYFNLGDMHTHDDNIGFVWSTTSNTVANSFGVSGVGVRFVDWDGDGRADYVWVSANGAVQVWLNKANNAGTATVTNWTSQGVVGPKVLDGTYRENVILADVDANGRADYCIVIRGDGSVGCWLNFPPASGSNVPQWKWTTIVTAAQVTANGGVTFLDEVNFADPDGDGAYDYLTTRADDCSVKAIRNACIPYNVPYPGDAN